MGDDFYIPIMSQDLMTSSMGMMNMPYGMYGGMPFMGGIPGPVPIPSPVLDKVRMQAQPPADQFIASKKKQETKNAFIKAAIVFAGIVGLACVMPKSKSKIGNFFKNIKNPFKKASQPTPSVTP